MLTRDDSVAPQASPALQIQTSDGLWQWLAEQNISLALTTYQTNRLFLIGRNQEPGRKAARRKTACCKEAREMTHPSDTPSRGGQP